MSKNKRTMLAVSGIIPLLGLFSHPPTVMLLLYSIFVWAYLRDQKKKAITTPRHHTMVTIITAALVVLVVAETLAWLDNYFKAFNNPGALFSTNYAQNLAIGAVYYLVLAFVWYGVNRVFRFNTLQAFISYGLFGIFLEQSGRVFNQAMTVLSSNPALSLLVLLFVFVVHGSIMGLIHLRLQPVLRKN